MKRSSPVSPAGSSSKEGSVTMPPVSQVNSRSHLESWMSDAACKFDSPTLYDEAFDKSPPSGVSCGFCGVISQCFTYAITNGFDGIWGGTTYKQRLKMMRRQVRAKCPGVTCAARGSSIQRGHAVDTCLKCGLSWPSARGAKDDTGDDAAVADAS